MTRPARNDPCPCGSGKKFKKCCLTLAQRIEKITGSRNTTIPLAAFAEGNNIEPAIAKAYFGQESIDLLSWKITELVFLKNLTDMVKAVRLCISGGYFVPALKLIYSAIDNLAYLGTQRMSVGKTDFIRLVGMYLLPDSGLVCTGEEMWAARCGLLHQNTAATCNLSRRLRRICYSTGSPQAQDGMEHVDQPEHVVFLSIDVLESALAKGMLRFVETAVRDSASKESLLARAHQYFAVVQDREEP